MSSGVGTFESRKKRKRKRVEVLRHTSHPLKQMNNNTLICYACYVKGGFMRGDGGYHWFPFDEAVSEDWVNNSYGDYVVECWVCGTKEGQCIQAWCLIMKGEGGGR